MTKMLRNKLIENKYISLLFIAIIGVALFSAHRSAFNFWQISLDHFPEETIAHSIQIVESNMDVFGYSPLQNPNMVASDVQDLGFGASIVTPGFFSMHWDLLSHQREWILNQVLFDLMWTGQFNMMVFGVIVATGAYKIRLTDGSRRTTIIKQLGVITLFVAIVVTVTSLLGTAIGSARFAQISNTEEMILLAPLHSLEGVWSPDFGYYSLALLGVFIYLLSSAIFGLLIGHIVGDAVFGVLLLTITANYLGWVLSATPLTPFYFLFDIVGFFIFTNTAMFETGYNLVGNLLMLLTYLAVSVFLSKIIMGFRIKRSAPDTDNLRLP